MVTKIVISRLGMVLAVSLAVVALVTLSVSSTLPPVWWWSVLLAGALAWLAVIDLEKMLLPDVLTFPLLGAGVLQAALVGAPEVTDSLLGAFFGYAALAGVGLVFERVRGVKGIGGGDAKLLAAGGAWLGWAGLPVVVLSASLGGLVLAVARWGRLRREGAAMALPFGPFLATGIWLGWCLLHRN